MLSGMLSRGMVASESMIIGKNKVMPTICAVRAVRAVRRRPESTKPRLNKLRQLNENASARDRIVSVSYLFEVR